MFNPVKLQALLLVLLASIAGCGADENDGNDGTSNPNNPGSDKASLTVNSAQYAVRVGNISPGAGRQFLLVEATLKNEAVSDPMRADMLLFSVSTEAKIVVMASPSSSLLDNYCAPDLSVGEGGSVTCGLAFEVPKNDQPATLHYEDPAASLELSAALSEIAEGPCLSVATMGTINLCLECAYYFCESALPAEECLYDTCMESCTTCGCEDACMVPNCGDLAPLRECVNTKCAAECGL